MDTSEVKRIIGSPLYIHQISKDGPIFYSYLAPPGSSYDVDVYFDKDLKYVICRPN